MIRPVIASLACALAAGAEPLKLSYTVSLPGVRGRFDHFAVSEDGARLAVAALGNGTVEILDLTAKKYLLSIPNQHKPCGLLFSDDHEKLYVTNGEAGTFKTLTTATGASVSSLTKLDDADNLRRDPSHFYIGYGEGAIAVINAPDGKLSHSISLSAHPESFQLETKGPRIFVNVPGTRQVVVVDREKKSIATTWPTGNHTWGGNFPMALDEMHHRLFIGCRQPASVVVLDTTDGHEISQAEISGDTDDLFYDAKRQCLYISCGAGFLDTLSVAADGTLKTLGHLATRSGARTCYFSAALDTLWLAVPQSNGHDAEIRDYQPATR